MNNNYYPNSKYERMNYDVLLNTLGLTPNNIDMNMNVEVTNNTNMNNQLYGPYEAYIKGNLFKNLYQQYKNYQPAKLVPSSEQEEAMLNLNQMQFAMHEANLFMDVYPNDPNIMRQFVNFRNNYNELLKNYQKKYGALNVNSSELNQIPFAWEEEVWPWDRRGL